MFEFARPNVRGVAKGALFETNSAGFRGPDRPIDKPEGVFRIMVIGDSFAMGIGVPYEETYAGRLAEVAATQIPGKSVEVLDIGLSGLNAHWVVERLERLGLRYAPDLMVYGYTLNDIEGKAYRRSAERQFTQPSYFAASPVYLWRYLGPRINSVRGLVGAPLGSYRHELDENYMRNPEAWKGVTEALDRLAIVAGERHACVVVLIHTHLFSLGFLHPFVQHYDAVDEAARQRGFYVAQSWPYHRGMDAVSLWILPWDSHPNTEGHTLLLRALADTLRDLPRSCWEPRDLRSEGLRRDDACLES